MHSEFFPNTKILVVITDGVPTFTSTPVRGAAKKWEDIGVVIYAIGVGESLSIDGMCSLAELACISSPCPVTIMMNMTFFMTMTKL